MYHILGFVAVVSAVVFIWVVGNYDAKLGYYFVEIYAAVILFFMIGLIMLAKRFLRKSDGREDRGEQPGLLGEGGGEGKQDKRGKELYLNCVRHDDEVGYRIENEQKAAEFTAVGKLMKGKVGSIRLCTGESDAGPDIVVTREQGAKQYVVWEKEQVLGSIKVRKDGVVYAGADDTVRYSASFAPESVSEEEEAVTGIMSLVTLGMFSREAKANVLLIYGPGDEVVGKYFFPLRNLELIADGNGAIDWRIVTVMAIMADVRLQMARDRG